MRNEFVFHIRVIAIVNQNISFNILRVRNRRYLRMKFNLFTLFLVQARLLNDFSRTIWILSQHCVLKTNEARFGWCLFAFYWRKWRSIIFCLRLPIKLGDSGLLGLLWGANLSNITEARCLIICLMLKIRIVLCNSGRVWTLGEWLCDSSFWAYFLWWVMIYQE